MGLVNAGVRKSTAATGHCSTFPLAPPTPLVCDSVTSAYPGETLGGHSTASRTVGLDRIHLAYGDGKENEILNGLICPDFNEAAL